MSQAQEKQIPLASLEGKLSALGLRNDTAAKLLLEALAKENISGHVVECVNNMISIAVSETKKRAKAAIDAL